MKIQLQGACNARDLGGIVTPHGTIAYGRLIRSDKLNRLTQQDKVLLQDIPLTRVIDLRTPSAFAKDPDILWDGVEYQLITVINKTTFGITYEGSTGKEIADMLQDGVNRMQAKGEIVEGHVQQIYRKLVSEEFSRNAFGTFIKTLARKPKDGATLWHCSVGKDRCGTCTALLLHCLGASKEQILQDYMLTNEQTANSTQGIIARVKPHLSEKNMALLHSMLTVQQSYLDSFYDEMQQLFGGIDQFIEACGVTEQDIAALRANYLQK